MTRVLIILPNDAFPGDRRIGLECAALRDSGYDVAVICPNVRNQAAHAVADGVEVFRFRPAPAGTGVIGFFTEYLWTWIATAWSMVKVLRSGGFDVLQAANPPDIFFPMGFLTRLFSKPFVFDQHDVCPELFTSKFGRDGGLLLFGVRLCERLTYRAASHVVAVNASYARIARERGGIPADAVTVVRNAPTPARFVPTDPQPALKQGREHLGVYVGIMEAQDGVDHAVRAVHHLVHVEGRRDCQFAFLGDGSCLPGLRALAAELDVTEWVTFTGWADDATVNAYLATADVGLQPDPKDAFTDVSTMVKTLEYLAFGLPVVAFDLAETRASTQGAAVYAEPNDASSFAACIARLLDDREARERMGADGRRLLAEGLAWEHQAPRYVSVLDRLTSGNGAVAGSEPAGYSR